MRQGACGRAEELERRQLRFVELEAHILRRRQLLESFLESREACVLVLLPAFVLRKSGIVLHLSIGQASLYGGGALGKVR